MKSWSGLDTKICCISSSCNYCFTDVPKQKEGVSWTQMDVGSYQHHALSTVFNHTCAVQCKNTWHILFDQFPQFCMPDGSKGNNLKNSCYCPLRQNFAKCITGLAFLSFFVTVIITVHHNQISVLQF